MLIRLGTTVQGTWGLRSYLVYSTRIKYFSCLGSYHLTAKSFMARKSIPLSSVIVLLSILKSCFRDLTLNFHLRKFDSFPRIGKLFNYISELCHCTLGTIGTVPDK